jgi:predicted phosphodiesterase
MAGNKPTLKNEIVRKYLKKFPTTPNAALARKIFKENPIQFKDAETIRTMIRAITGNNGSSHKNSLKDKSLISKAKPCNPYNLPNSYESDFTVFDIKQSRILILSDLHFPYQNNMAVEVALDYGKLKKVDCILINGDLIDFANISRHDKDWRSRSINDEFESVRTFLKSLRLNFPNTRIIYKHGNHDERWEKFLYVKAPEIFDVSDFQLEVLLRLGELKIETVKDKRPIRLGKLTVLHGQELTGSGGVNPSKSTFNKTLNDTLIGHVHKTSYHSEPRMNGEIISVYSTGCLCELHPIWMPINKWTLGFAYVDLDIKTGNYIVHNKMIIDNKII